MDIRYLPQLQAPEMSISLTFRETCLSDEMFHRSFRLSIRLMLIESLECIFACASSHPHRKSRPAHHRLLNAQRSQNRLLPPG
jgi:hypothetical protein